MDEMTIALTGGVFSKQLLSTMNECIKVTTQTAILDGTRTAIAAYPALWEPIARLGSGARRRYLVNAHARKLALT
jgi:hypothetical protein